jgi:putative addiction module CopG family antidote
MNVTLPPDLVEIINKSIASGQYKNAGDYIRRAILQAEEIEQLKKQRLSNAIKEGIDQLNAGQSRELKLSELIDELDKELDYPES